MPRPHKNPEIRINEIIETAEALFEEKGYYNTTIQDIVTTMGVAPGTIYYYFRSKDAILDGIVNRHIFKFAEHIQLIVTSEQRNAVDKLQAVIRQMFTSMRRDHNKLLFEFLYNDYTLQTLQRIERQTKIMLSEPLCTIIQQGINEKEFECGNAVVVANVILALLYSLVAAIYARVSPDIFSLQIILTEKLFIQALGSTKEVRIYTG